MPDKTSGEGSPSRNETPAARPGIKRPLVPIVLALMLGLAGAAWGLQVPRTWLLAGLTGLLGIILLLWILASSRQKGKGRPNN
jgi:hypothetical protein